MNKPDDFDNWRLPDDDSVKKVSVIKDTKVPSAAMFVIEREDHTLGNMVRYQLLEDDNVLFGGYRVPHPLEPAIQVKVQTRQEGPSPAQAMHSALDSLLSELNTFEERFKVHAPSRPPRGTRSLAVGGGSPRWSHGPRRPRPLMGIAPTPRAVQVAVNSKQQDSQGGAGLMDTGGM